MDKMISKDEMARCLEKWKDSKYCSVHDAQYKIKTGAWLEKGCSNPECEFCGNKPEKHSKECKCGGK